jgi:hypothetical protein
VSVLFHSNNIIIWNPTMTFGTHCTYFTSVHFLPCASEQKWSEGSEQFSVS